MSNESPVEFARLWTRAQPNVLAYISATVRNFQDAEDVLQNVAVTAVKKFDEYDPARPFAGWIIGIARIEVMRYLRRHGNDRHQLVDEEVLVRLAGACERNMEELDGERAALSKCLKRLSGRLRDVIERRYGEGMKTAEIAAVTGLKPAYVSVSLNRAYRELRKCMNRQREVKE